MATTKSPFIMQLPRNIHLGTLLPRLQEEKARAYTTIVFTLLAITIFGFFAINPTFGTIADLSKQLSDNQFVDQQLTVKIANLTKLQQQYQQLQTSLPVILTAIPTTPTMPYFIGQVQELATRAHVDLVRIQTFPIEIPAGDISTTKFYSYVFGIDIQGNQDNINNFIDSLNTFNRLVTIDGISVTAVHLNNVEARANIRGDVFFKK